MTEKELAETRAALLGAPQLRTAPNAETKEQLGGILVLEARDKNHAVHLMAQHPALKCGNIFEIRLAADLNEMMKVRTFYFRWKYPSDPLVD